MPKLQKYVINKLLFENTPELVRNQCLNSLQSKYPCTLCQEVCPSGAIVDGTLDPAVCIGCNSCVAVCPSQCLRPSKKFMAHMLEVLEQDKDHWVISCERQDYPADLKLSCLGSLPWEIMALLSLQGELSPIQKDCAKCPRKEHLHQWELSVEKLRAFWGEDTFAEKIHVCSEDTPVPHQTLSRREAFTFLLTKFKNKTMSSLVLDDKSLDPDGSVYRQILVYRLLQLQNSSDPLASSWIFPTFTSTCTACGICVKICPRQALHRLEAAEHQPGTKTWYMAVVPWRCTNCGLCQRVCPRNGLGDCTYKRTQDPSRPSVTTITAPFCRRCGEPMPGETGPVLGETGPVFGETDDICMFCKAEDIDHTKFFFDS
ncbi:MAG: 4Fe-4S dicluster domain-containing protein [Peptococcaceae bacterium]|nr:4Fe-4S dicluster domain-containing protein [Peptococcaceae bacterium]